LTICKPINYNMTQERFSYLFTKHLKGACSDIEYQEFTSLLNSGKYDSIASKLMDEHWTISTEVDMDVPAAEKILHNIFAHDEVMTNGQFALVKRIWIAVAAAAVVLIVSSLLYFKTSPADPLNVPARQLAINSRPVRNYSTSNEHKKIILPDGSTVVLNTNSTLIIASDFNRSKREVKIIGEGYFDIKHDIAKSFIVSSGNIKTTVLGTAFNVRAYTNSEVEVTVTRGKVSVLAGQKLLGILTPNRKITVPHQKIRPVLSNVVARNAIKWQENDLFFDNITFDAAVVILSKKFNTPISFADEKARNCRFTATFLQGESLEEVLKVICSFNNAEYHKNAAGILINGPGC
jgi:transmembrane sensor